MQIPQGFKMARAFIISAKLRLLKSVRKAAYYGVEFFLKSHFFYFRNAYQHGLSKSCSIEHLKEYEADP